MYVLVFIQNYWYEILLVPATWYMILHILYLVINIKLKHARNTEILYSDSVIPNKFSVINIFKDNYNRMK